MEEMRAREKDDDGNEMHWRLRRMMRRLRDGGKTKGKMKNRNAKEEQDDLLSWTRLDDERC